MLRSVIVALAGAVALSAAAGAAQAQSGPGPRNYDQRYDYRYDYPPPPQRGQNQNRSSNQDRYSNQDRFSNQDRYSNQNRFSKQDRFSNRDRSANGDRFANQDRNGRNRGGPQGNQQAQGGDGAYLGVEVQPLNSNLADALKLPDSNGALISDVQTNSPAANAGIKAGDVVVALNGKAINNASDLVQAIRGDQPNMPVTVTVSRQGAKQDIPVTLGGSARNGAAQNQPGPNNGPQAPAPTGSLGITIGAGPGQSGGVVITAVSPNSPAERAGLQRGDQILAVGDTTISSANDVTTAVNALKQGGAKNVLLRVRSGQTAKFVVVQVG